MLPGSFQTQKCRSLFRCYPAILRMTGQRCWKSVRALAAMKRRCLREICTACMNAMPLAKAGRLNRFRSAPPMLAGLRKS